MPEQIPLPDGYDGKDELTWFVIDANASGTYGEQNAKSRNHKLIVDERQFDGTTVAKPKSFPFWSRRPTAVPREAAMRLLNRGIANFEIYNHHGLRCVMRKEFLQSGAQIELGPTEVIADLSELKIESLRERCAGLPGGPDMLRKRPSEQDCISFILKGGDPTHGIVPVQNVTESDIQHYVDPRAIQTTTEDEKPKRGRKAAAKKTAARDADDDDDGFFDPPAKTDKELAAMEDEAQAEADAAGADIEIPSSKPVAPPKPPSRRTPSLPAV